jgi:hypothetical protein
MQWSKLRSSIEARFAPALRGRVSLHQARYRHAREEVGRIWIAVDGRELASFATGARWRQVREAADRLMDERAAWGSPEAYEAAVGEAAAAVREAGTFADDDALVELEAYLSLPVAEALGSPSPLQRALAVLDARVGKRRLAALLAEPDGHALVRAVLEVRCAADGIRPRPPAA